MRTRLVRPGSGRLVSSGFVARPTAHTPLYVVVCRRCAASFSSSARAASPKDDDNNNDDGTDWSTPFGASLTELPRPRPPETYAEYVSPFPLPPRALPLLYGKTAVVTGGSRGIGWAIAARLAQEGVSCVLIGRDEAVLARAVRALPRPLPPQDGPLKVPLVAGMPTGYVPGVVMAAGEAAATAAAEGAEPVSPVQHHYRVGDVRDEALWRELFAWEDSDRLGEEEDAAAEAAEAEAAAAVAAMGEESQAAHAAQMAKLVEDAAAELARGGGDKLQALLREWSAEADSSRAAQAQAQAQAALEAQEAARAAAREKRMLRKRTADVHLLVNAAGVTHRQPIARLGPDEIRSVLDTNLLGTTLGCAFAMRAWVRRRQKNRCIINIASLLAVQGGAGSAVYAASKAGVIGLTRGLAAEGAGPRRRIRANVILPGYIQTDMLDFLTGDRLKAITTKIPSSRLGSAFEVADAALFLAKNDYANNCVLNLDGGLSAVL